MNFCKIIINAVRFVRSAFRGVAQFGRALRSGRRGRGFESRRLDAKTLEFSRVFFFVLHFVLHE